LDVPTTTRAPAPRPPAQRIDAHGCAHVDYGAVWRLAGPLIANSAVQAVLNLTDTWFVGRISTTALAAVSAIYWVVLVVLIFLGGIGMATQTLAAQAYGSGRRRRAAQAGWSGLYASLAALPLFALAALGGPPLLAALHLDPEVQRMALEYWWPRLLAGGPLALMVWTLTGFFNGVGRSRVTLIVTVAIALSNVPFNQLFMFELGMGIAGAAWGTVAAQLVGLAVAAAYFLGPRVRRTFGSHLVWRRPRVRRQIALGLPMGLSATADMLGLALFQLMLVSVGTVPGAATQVVIMLTSLAYMPGVGIAMAGTTLVGQAIGAGDRDWAARLGNGVIALAVVFMGVVGVLLALAGPVLLPLFVATADADAAAVIALGAPLLWLAACYQAFDGLNLGSGFCLRGAGDVHLPAVLVAALSWLVWVPLTHALTFAPGEGWVNFLPQFGLGAIGGWWAAVVYVVLLGLALWLRWRSGAWRRVRIGG
jgi:MATE family multidrug resistance protein